MTSLYEAPLLILNIKSSLSYYLPYRCLSRDQCIPTSYHCDGQMDCLDRSDEIGCVTPTVTVPPPPFINVQVGGTIRITCTAVGKPVPLISWRLNWGNIPTGARVTVSMSTQNTSRPQQYIYIYIILY